MSPEVQYCFVGDGLADVGQNMGEIQVRRLPVLNSDKRIVGILSLADVAVADGPGNVGNAMCGIARPGGDHSQSLKTQRARA
jgi:CBS domain-containing protein